MAVGRPIRHPVTQYEHSPDYRLTFRVTVVGGVFDLILGLIKIVVGLLAHSQALVADGIHSLSDLVSDVMVILAARHAGRDADDRHPYGHDRIETVASVVLAAILAVVALGIGWDSLVRLQSDQAPAVPGILALAVATASALVKEFIYHYTMRAARRLNSKLLAANAWHSRSDALSSLVVMIGLGGALLGYPWADAVAAIVVSGMILQVAWGIGREGVAELIDTGLDDRELAKIRDAVLAVNGVRDMHELRTRRMGSGVLADMHIHVPSAVSVSEGHRIGDEVHARLKRQFSFLSDIVVHVDCEDDTEQRPSSMLPLRDRVEQQVHRQVVECLGSADAYRRLTLHYLGGKLHMELWLRPDAARVDDVDGAIAELRQRLEAIPNSGNVVMLSELETPRRDKAD